MALRQNFDYGTTGPLFFGKNYLPANRTAKITITAGTPIELAVSGGDYTIPNGTPFEARFVVIQPDNEVLIEATSDGSEVANPEAGSFGVSDTFWHQLQGDNPRMKIDAADTSADLRITFVE